MIQLLLLWLAPVVAADPQRPNTLVLPSGEEIELPYIRNWTAPEAQKSLRWPACQGSSSAMSGPTAITLHEVGAPNDNFGDPSGKNRCIHFYVRQDGVILQLAPLDRTWGHAPNAGHAIGVEIANGYGGANVSSSSGADRIAVSWSGARYLYWQTPPQFDNLYDLMMKLAEIDFNGDGVADIPKNVANERMVDDYFLLSTQGLRINPTVDGWLNSYEGILSHSIHAYADEVLVDDGAGGLKRTFPSARNDGGAMALYTTLRLRGLSADEARCYAMQLAQDKLLTDPSVVASVGIASQDFVYHTWKAIPLNINEQACVLELGP